MSDEGFDGGGDFGSISGDVSLDVDTGADSTAGESGDINIEPLTDIPVEEPASMEGAIDSTLAVPEQELAELQNEAAALEIDPLDEGVDIGCNWDEAVQEANAQREAEDQAYQPSTLENIINAGARGAASPSAAAQIGGEILAPPGAGESLAQGLQAGVNMGTEGIKGIAEGLHTQHAFPSPPLEGVDFIRNADGEPEQIQPMVSTVDENGERIWVRPEKSKAGEK